ncbi:hypothetical protein [Amaricoccus sp.]|uniref:hypothetical protein n=1 Tax=Amaricoccus sp. TaxID=1872485 RepID=UPI001B69CCD4|nr:hypothetical protein [Amaricoccus sp.]MBP7242929.1 hypothetical protein [Amaricoccus sp.]
MSGFGARLREERRRLGLSQSAFGALAGVKKNAQFNYEADRRAADARYLTAAAAHGVDVLYLLTGRREGAPAIEIRPAGAAAEPPAGREPASPRVTPTDRAGWRRVSGALRRFEASRTADVVGAGIVAFLAYAVLFVFMGGLG